MEIRTLKSSELNSIMKATKRKTWLFKNLLTFLESGAPAAEVIGWQNDYNSVHSAYSAVYSCSKRNKLPIRLVTRDGRVFLCRTDV